MSIQYRHQEDVSTSLIQRSAVEFCRQFERSILDQLRAAGVHVVREPGAIGYGRPDERKRYFPDFSVTTKDAQTVYIEAKGWLNTKAAEKMRYAKAFNPTKDIRFVFQNGKTKVGRLKSTNLQWAKRNHFPAAVKIVPDEWIKDFMTVEETLGHMQ